MFPIGKCFWAYPHNEIGTHINKDFVLRWPQDAIKIPKRHSIKGSNNAWAIQNIGHLEKWQVALPKNEGGSMFVVDSNPIAGYDYNHKRVLWLNDEGELGAPTIVQVSLERFSALLDPRVSDYTRLWHAVEQVLSWKYSIPYRTHRILDLWVKEYDHWLELIDTVRGSGNLIVTFDAIFAAYKKNMRVTDRLHTPWVQRGPTHSVMYQNATWQSAKKKARIDPTGVWWK